MSPTERDEDAPSVALIDALYEERHPDIERARGATCLIEVTR